MILRKLIIAIAATLCFYGSAQAQLPQPTPNETGLTLEVVFLKGKPPAYQRIPRLSQKKGGSWYALFGRIAGWQLPNGALPVNAVRLVPSLKSEVVNIRVSVLRGPYLDVEDRVGSYKVQENEATTLSELQAFGVEPFVVKVVRISALSDFPATSSKAKSVTVVGIEPDIAPLPRYKLTLHNLSDKNIVALSIDILGQGRVRKTGMPQGDYGEPLIKARDSGNLSESLALDAEKTLDGYQPLPLPAQQIVVESLIFEDGSHEGELKPAAMFLGFAAGRRIELARVLPLLEEVSSASDVASAPDALRSRLSALSYEPDETEIASLIAAFPTVDKAELRGSVEIAIHGVRSGLLAQLERVPKSEAKAKDFSAWLVRTRQLYSNWLSRLNLIKISED